MDMARTACGRGRLTSTVASRFSFDASCIALICSGGNLNPHSYDSAS